MFKFSNINERSMNIVFVITDLTTLGGVERTTLLLANELIEKGYKIQIVSLFKRNDFVKFPLGQISDIQYVINRGYLLKEDSSNRFFSIISLFAVLLRFKKTFKKIDPSSIYVAQCFLPAAFLWLFGKSKQTIVCEHFKYELYNKVICMFRDRIYSKLLQVITLTQEDCKKYLKVLSNVRVIPNMSPYSVSKVSDMTNQRIVSVGRLTFQKGYDFLIKAISECKNEIKGWSIHVFGEGELYDDLISMAENNQVNDILHFEGYSSNIENELLNSSIFVLSSRFEGLPMVLLEAMSKGLAIISFDCPEGPRALLHDGAGLLVEKENPSELAAAIVKLTKSCALRTDYSEKAQLAINKFSAENVILLWSNLFKDLNLE